MIYHYKMASNTFTEKSGTSETQLGGSQKL